MFLQDSIDDVPRARPPRTCETYRTEPVSRGPVSEMVSATGEVSAIITVNIGSQAVDAASH
ncbi:MAG: hypothetical protein ACJ79D_08050, partial [Myxococcales bacterium]